MKNAKRICSFVCIISLCIALICMPAARAEALTLGILGGAMIAVGASLGLYYFSNSQSSVNFRNWAESRINTFLNGQSITDVFGSEIIRLTAGKLIVPATIYNKFLDIFNQDVDESGINPGDTATIGGQFYGYPVVFQSKNPETIGFTQSYAFSSEVSSVGLSCILSGSTVRVYVNGELKNTRSITTGTATSWYLHSQFPPADNYIWLGVVTNTGSWSAGQIATVGDYVTIARLEKNIDQTVLNPTQDWAGTIDGAPDTNLEQLIGSIYNKGAIDELNVDGEIIEPGPAPTPIPTYPPVDDILPGINTGIEIGNDLIVGQQAQTGAITQGLEGVQESVGSLEGTIEAIADTPTTEELPDFKFDLRELFPFCIPFDIYRLLSSFDAEPAAPHVQLPIVIDSINFRYNLDLDFSSWNPVAQAMRTAELIVYAIALAWATGKVIKW